MGVKGAGKSAFGLFGGALLRIDVFVPHDAVEKIIHVSWNDIHRVGVATVPHPINLAGVAFQNGGCQFIGWGQSAALMKEPQCVDETWPDFL